MKKVLLTCMAAMGLAASASAQLTEGSVFPDFTLTDINGNVHHLYDDLNSGKTVFIDISATWCNPCWNYHIGHHLDSLWNQHGPTGATGVSASTTNDVVVYFVQGEPTSNLAELYDGPGATAGSASVETPYATSSQGNWVAGSDYYMIDDTTSTDPVVGTAALDAAWNIAYFPTVYMICRDHLVHVMTQPSAVEAYAASLATCPTYAPSATIDAKAVSYLGNSYFICNATPSVSFQNYSATNNITSATINVKDATGATVGTQSWTGTLAPYDVTSVPVTAFAGTSFGGYKYSVSVTGDSNPANDASADSLFKVYAASNAGAVPASEDFEGSGSYKESYNSDGYEFPAVASSLVGPDGSAGDNVLLYEFYYDNPASDGGISEFVFGNFDLSSAAGITFQFDVAYAQYDATSTDALAVKVSTDCGVTWTTAWTQSGATLATAPVDGTSEFIPSAASQWKHVSVDMSTYASANVLIKMVGTSNYGNDAFVDNLKLGNTTAVAQVSAVNEISMAPNPAKDMTNINLDLATAATVQVQVTDAVGRVVNTINQNMTAGAQKIELSTTDMAAGIYNVKITAGSSTIVKQLSVIK